ncbi:NmrA family NAD(P)-binding protein [Streptomyces orinoci]|uniref:NAD(P)H-binding protein n=1 Tax=Streptomyces orinoci TaxID=67339 RepID=A0ABV3JZQ7_STRON|nr:NAD(P)H-binding protein [Streptomyces orinoci]
MTTLVTGARGRVGRTLIELLHARGLPVRAASKAPEELQLPAGLEAVSCSLADPGTFAAALEGVRAVFLYAEPEHIDAFLAAAAKAGVAHIVLLSSSSVLAPHAADHPIAGPHWRVEQALAAASVTSTVLRPGHFATNALGWAHAVRSGGVIRLPYPEAHADPIHERDLAEAALAVLTEPDKAGGAHVLTGPESLTFREQVERVGRAAGRPVTVQRVSPEEWKREMAQYIPGPLADALLGLWRDSDGREQEITDEVRELTGHPARSFAQWAQDHAADFGG